MRKAAVYLAVLALVWALPQRGYTQDTLEAGDGLCRKEVVEMVVASGPERVRELMEWGIAFTQDSGGSLELDLGLEGGHSQKRIVHAGDLTGHAIEQVLLDRAREHKQIDIMEHHIAVDLITYSMRIKRGVVTAAHEAICCGAYVLGVGQNLTDTSFLFTGVSFQFSTAGDFMDVVNLFSGINVAGGSFEVVTVSEPGTLAILGIGLFAMGLARKRRA